MDVSRIRALTIDDIPTSDKEMVIFLLCNWKGLNHISIARTYSNVEFNYRNMRRRVWGTASYVTVKRYREDPKYKAERDMMAEDFKTFCNRMNSALKEVDDLYKKYDGNMQWYEEERWGISI